MHLNTEESNKCDSCLHCDVCEWAITSDIPFNCDDYIAKAMYYKAIKALEDVKGLSLLVDWAVDCGFGYDNIPEEYEKYKEEISDMRYIEGLIHIAKREADMRKEIKDD